MPIARPGKLVVVSGPSGAGKTTVTRRVLAEPPVPLVRSVSATTRQPRPGEIDGRDYLFLSDEEFGRRRSQGDFLECFQVFGRDAWYGTLKSTVAAGLEAGNWILLEIDVQGGREVMRLHPDAVSIFIRPRCLEELERRLRGRGTETEGAIVRRLRRAAAELAEAEHYRYQVVNDDVERAVQEINDILTQEAEKTCSTN